MRIAVIGAGWYGCHIASVLLSQGFDVKVFDKGDRIFSGASGTNQNRLHVGYHYPRSAITRRQSKEGFRRFLKAYPMLSSPVADNIYAVATTSALDFETYLKVVADPDEAWHVVDPESHGLANVEGAIRVDERLIHTDAARKWFEHTLKGHVFLRTTFQSTADAVIDCTWGHRNPAPGWEFERATMLVYRGDIRHPAITVMDGPFPSLYPIGGGLFSLTSALWSSLPEDIDYLRPGMEADMSRFLPDFREKFAFVEARTAIKTKPINSASAARPCLVDTAPDGTIRVMSGKIDTIFHAADEVLRLLGLSVAKEIAA